MLTTLSDSAKGDLMTTGVPVHLHRGLVNYVENGIRTGNFLYAVLTNDLKDACARADDSSKHAIYEVVQWLYNHAPSACWGNVENVSNWLKKAEGR